jgi:hypothetical protein
MRTYSVAPMDRLAWIVTAYITGLTGVFIILGVLLPASRFLLAPAAALLLVIWMSWQIAPKRCELTGDVLVIVRGWPFRDISIPVGEIREVTRVKISPFTIRSFGVGGLFSWSGWFWNREIGSFFAEITNIGRTVLIDAGKKYVISPEVPEQFVQDIQSRFSAIPT